MPNLNISDKPVSNIPVLPIGTYQGVISAIWDIGVQRNEYQGEVKHQHKILVRVEVNKLIEADGDYNGKRYSPISWLTVPRSYSDLSNLVKLANAANKRTMTAGEFAEFDTDTLLGKNVFVSITHTSGGKAKIAGFTPSMEGMVDLVPELDGGIPDWVKELASKAIGATPPVQPTPPVEAYSQPQDPLSDLPF